MAGQAADQQRNRRQRARERRRSLAAEPFERLDEEARRDGSGAVKQTLATAAAGAVAAGIAGAAKALRDRQSQEPEEKPAETGDEATPSSDAEAEEAGADATEPAAGEDDGLQREPTATAGEDGSDGNDEAEEVEEQPEDEPRDESTPGAEAQGDEDDRQGTSPGQAKDVVAAARRQLREILGVEPESVSGFERNGDCWTVTLEVIEMKRIPESTDVLSSYEVTIDDDGNVVSAAQRRRYRRSQVEEG